MVCNVIEKDRHSVLVFAVDPASPGRWREPVWNERLRRLAREGLEGKEGVFLVQVEDDGRWIVLPDGPVKWSANAVPLPIGEDDEGVVWRYRECVSHLAAQVEFEACRRAPSGPKVRALWEGAWAGMRA
jgi:hypothetical protein